VKAKKPTLDFDPRYGTDTGFWTTHVRRDDLQGDGRLNPPAAPRLPRGRGRTRTRRGAENERGLQDPPGRALRPRAAVRCG
jgi:hypothetical protein